MLDRAHVTFAILAILGLSASGAAGTACTKSEGQTSGTAASSSAVTKDSPPASASVSATAAAASAAPVPADTASAAPSATTAVAASATASAAPKASAAAGGGADLAAANAACGTKPLPDCPLQAWMKANTNPAIASNDLPALATALDKAASMGPAAYGNWASIAKDGAKAAKAGDMTAAKASCRTCHDQYKTKYKAELRGRKI